MGLAYDDFDLLRPCKRYGWPRGTKGQKCTLRTRGPRHGALSTNCRLRISTSRCISNGWHARPLPQLVVVGNTRASTKPVAANSSLYIRRAEQGLQHIRSR